MFQTALLLSGCVQRPTESPRSSMSLLCLVQYLTFQIMLVVRESALLNTTVSTLIYWCRLVVRYRTNLHFLFSKYDQEFVLKLGSQLYFQSGGCRQGTFSSGGHRYICGLMLISTFLLVTIHIQVIQLRFDNAVPF
ncbi:Hypothetical_protein [Hexamita inflata]|uniref:Hypothetical_protein n=2 Tax=Hexamita inflata TaxID=28002 RepID=A0AA86PPF3_9EUKA|nr:Hypothetical protein HINF_LOCUS29607 [Hexamita inflata]